MKVRVDENAGGAVFGSNGAAVSSFCGGILLQRIWE
jgi:hypothetical protein